MLIDWFTVFAQIVNFLILVVLLKKFLYKPILDAMDAREHKIDNNIREAQKTKKDAEASSAILAKQLAELSDDRTKRLQATTDEVNAARTKMTAEARDDVSALKERWEASLTSEHEALTHRLAERIQQEVVSIARQVLLDLADEKLEERLTQQFMNRFVKLNEDDLKAVNAALQAKDDPVLVRTAFEFPAEMQKAFETSARKRISTKNVFQFQTAPDMVCGIEIVVPGHVINWSVQSTLASLEASVEELLKQERTPDAA